MVILDSFEIYLILRISSKVKMIKSNVEFLLKITKLILTNLGYITNCLFHYKFNIIEAQI